MCSLFQLFIFYGMHSQHSSQNTQFLNFVVRTYHLLLSEVSLMFTSHCSNPGGLSSQAQEEDY